MSFSVSRAWAPNNILNHLELKLRTLIYTLRAWAPNLYPHIQLECRELKLWKCFTVFRAWAPSRISNIQRLRSRQHFEHWELKLRTLIYTLRAWAPNLYPHIQPACLWPLQHPTVIINPAIWRSSCAKLSLIISSPNHHYQSSNLEK